MSLLIFFSCDNNDDNQHPSEAVGIITQDTGNSGGSANLSYIADATSATELTYPNDYHGNITLTLLYNIDITTIADNIASGENTGLAFITDGVTTTENFDNVFTYCALDGGRNLVSQDIGATRIDIPRFTEDVTTTTTFMFEQFQAVSNTLTGNGTIDFSADGGGYIQIGINDIDPLVPTLPTIIKNTPSDPIVLGANVDLYPIQTLRESIDSVVVKKADKLIGKGVLYKTEALREIKGKITGAHGNKGAVKVLFEKGMPGQSLTKQVEILAAKTVVAAA